MFKKFLKDFLSLEDSEKNKIIFPVLLLTNIILFFPGEVPRFYIILMLNIFLITPIIIPIVFILPFIYKSKKSFLFYLYFVTNSFNLFWYGMVLHNIVFNENNILILIPLIFGISIAMYMLKLKRNYGINS